MTAVGLEEAGFVHGLKWLDHKGRKGSAQVAQTPGRAVSYQPKVRWPIPCILHIRYRLINSVTIHQSLSRLMRLLPRSRCQIVYIGTGRSAA